jgi:hypothetical protein
VNDSEWIRCFGEPFEAVRDYRWVNVRPGTGITPSRLAHDARYEPPDLAAPLIARCGFMFGPEDMVTAPARPYPRCLHCEHLAQAEREGRPADYVAGYRAALHVAWKVARRDAEVGAS